MKLLQSRIIFLSEIKITLTHAKLGSDKGVYTDLIKEKSAYETVEIKGIYQIKNNSDNALNPTAKKVENLLFSDSQLLINLKEQTQGIYEGEISFSLLTHYALIKW